MMSSSVCAEFETAGTIDRYVAGRSSAAETADFELHLIGCETCQESIRVAAASGAALRHMPSATGDRQRRIFTPNRIIALAASLVAIVMGASWFEKRAALRSLGNVAVAPQYQGMQVRSSVSAADSLFAHGMTLYGAGRFHDARETLARAVAAGADSAPACFFMAATHLVSRGGADAIPLLRVVLRAGETPYEPEAHYFIAKAFLQLGRTDSALAHLRVAGGANSVGSVARALADSVAEVQR